MTNPNVYEQRLAECTKPDCDGGCGRLVEVGEKRCRDCAELEALFARKLLHDQRMAEFARAVAAHQLACSASGVAEYARVDVGLAEFEPGATCEREDLRMTLREKAACVALFGGAFVGGAWIAFLGWLCLRALVALVMNIQ
jgi:hypothetical protein